MVSTSRTDISSVCQLEAQLYKFTEEDGDEDSTNPSTVLYHQIEKVKKPEDLAERQQNLEQLKKEHGIE